MLCNKCKKNEATVYMRTTINGKTTETALCRECAEEEGEPSGFKSSFAPLEHNLFGGLFGFPNLKSVPSEARAAEVRRCPVCGASFEEIAKEGKVGCGECYSAFRDRLSGSIARIHGNVRHIGRTPEGRGTRSEEDIRNEKLASLREAQKKAIASEDFEEAARLRDEIKKLEGEERLK